MDLQLENSDPLYSEKLKLLEDSLDKAENWETAYNVIQKFATKYIMPWTLWEIFYQLAMQFDENSDEIAAFFELADFHMFYPRKCDVVLQEDHFSRKKLFSNSRGITIGDFFMECKKNGSWLQKDLSILIQALQYPHPHLDQIWAKYEMHSNSSPSKEIFQKYNAMKELYAKIEIADKNDNFEKWCEAIIESGHEEFIYANIEYKIGGDLTNKKLWKFYIYYLKSRDFKKMLETYSKYCRFFLTDIKMKDNYEREMKKYGILKMPWKNAFAWEVYKPKSIKVVPKIPKMPKQTMDSILCHFSPKNVVPQNFPFKSTLIHYLQQNANADTLFKLSTLCKFLHILKPHSICYSLVLSKSKGKYIHYNKNTMKVLDYNRQENSIKYQGQSMEVFDSDLSAFKNYIYVSTVFQAYDTKMLSESLSKVICCTAKYISLGNVSLKRVEMEILLKHGNVVNFELQNVTVVDSEDAHMQIEDMLKMTPKTY
uniref:Uncharacterized protein n=1 Tax=Panagrolaimus superbus TaxID=310955 RepID=A0A914YWN0_9BILA